MPQLVRKPINHKFSCGITVAGRNTLRLKSGRATEEYMDRDNRWAIYNGTKDIVSMELRYVFHVMDFIKGEF